MALRDCIEKLDFDIAATFEISNPFPKETHIEQTLQIIARVGANVGVRTRGVQQRIALLHALMVWAFTPEGFEILDGKLCFAALLIVRCTIPTNS